MLGHNYHFLFHDFSRIVISTFLLPVSNVANIFIFMKSCFPFVLVTLRDFCEVRTKSRFHIVVVTLCDSCEVRTEFHFHFVVVTLRDSCEVRTESHFHFVV
jgi:hypothetical protein